MAPGQQRPSLRGLLTAGPSGWWVLRGRPRSPRPIRGPQDRAAAWGRKQEIAGRSTSPLHAAAAAASGWRGQASPPPPLLLLLLSLPPPPAVEMLRGGRPPPLGQRWRRGRNQPEAHPEQASRCHARDRDRRTILRDRDRHPRHGPGRVRRRSPSQCWAGRVPRLEQASRRHARNRRQLRCLGRARSRRRANRRRTRSIQGREQARHQHSGWRGCGAGRLEST